ncbi:putative wall-associated receptor kinase-like 16 [Neltuma alba]|uniref:putative wall-associated receptor kinase-like 16 n=1 Tax=Neltuma alba TaxID=207710 RepID=UPI0010A31DB3|nr:putative wall-associated receptor kinase-like 16 [Prosopis alba]
MSSKQADILHKPWSCLKPWFPLMKPWQRTTLLVHSLRFAVLAILSTVLYSRRDHSSARFALLAISAIFALRSARAFTLKKLTFSARRFALQPTPSGSLVHRARAVAGSVVVLRRRRDEDDGDEGRFPLYRRAASPSCVYASVPCFSQPPSPVCVCFVLCSFGMFSLSLLRLVFSFSAKMKKKIEYRTSGAIVALVVCVSWLYLIYQKWNLIKQKEKLFQQNGGFIMQQRLSVKEASSQTVKIFTTEELKRATDNYHYSSILGEGGYGTVYKGSLTDKKIVAIKKSKLLDQNRIEQFINEIIVLSQINHKNVVKLLGCCLETEIPLLVYELVNNGTLYGHIHDEEKASKMSCETHLKIAAETAEALSYLHSGACIPIIHRDVKTSNILLDEEYTAKVSDFGASKLVPLDQRELATMVQGTLGYLDPEYMQTSQLTEKSDVYSFGVVLVELLTGKKALSFDKPEEERCLAKYFLSSLKRGQLFELLEVRIMNDENNKEMLREVASLAERCLRVCLAIDRAGVDWLLVMQGLDWWQAYVRDLGNQDVWSETDHHITHSHNSCLQLVKL